MRLGGVVAHDEAGIQTGLCVRGAVARGLIDAAMRLILARMELLSFGSTAALGATTSPTCEEPGGRRPPGETNPPHLVFAGRYRACGSEQERLAVLAEAQATYRELTTRRRVVVCDESAEGWKTRVLEASGWPARDVAIALRCSTTAVRKLRVTQGFDPESGQPAVLDIDLLRKRGASFREIARLVGRPEATVRYQLTKNR